MQLRRDKAVRVIANGCLGAGGDSEAAKTNREKGIVVPGGAEAGEYPLIDNSVMLLWGRILQGTFLSLFFYSIPSSSLSPCCAAPAPGFWTSEPFPPQTQRKSSLVQGNTRPIQENQGTRVLVIFYTRASTFCISSFLSISMGFTQHR